MGAVKKQYQEREEIKQDCRDILEEIMEYSPRYVYMALLKLKKKMDERENQ